MNQTDMSEGAGAEKQAVFRRLHVVAMAFGLWTALVILFATQFVLVGSSSWKEAFVQTACFWSVWLVLMPAVVFLSLRFQIEPGRLATNLGIHILACVGAVVLSQMAFRHIIPIPPPPRGETAQGAEGSRMPPDETTLERSGGPASWRATAVLPAGFWVFGRAWTFWYTGLCSEFARAWPVFAAPRNANAVRQSLRRAWRKANCKHCGCKSTRIFSSIRLTPFPRLFT